MLKNDHPISFCDYTLILEKYIDVLLSFLLSKVFVEMITEPISYVRLMTTEYPFRWPLKHTSQAIEIDSLSYFNIIPSNDAYVIHLHMQIPEKS